MHRLLVLLITLCAGSSLAYAQFDPQWAFNGAPQATQLYTSYMTTKIMLDASQAAYGSRSGSSSGSSGSSGSKPAAPRSISTTTKGHAKAAASLAKAYPEQHRAQAQKVFAQLLDGFAKIETSIGSSIDLPHGDVAGASALLLIASYEAYQNTSLDPALYAPVISQLRQRIGQSSVFISATAAQRRQMYEELAILGMMVAAVHQKVGDDAKGPDAERLRAAAAGYLKQLLNAEPDKVQITSAGVVIK
jgi:hypothetical protein